MQNIVNSALLSIPSNLIQGCIAIISGILFMKMLEQTGLSNWIKNKYNKLAGSVNLDKTFLIG